PPQGGPGTSGGPGGAVGQGGPGGPGASGSNGFGSVGGPGTGKGVGGPGTGNPNGFGPGGPGIVGGLAGPTGLGGSQNPGAGTLGPGGGLSDDTAILTPQKPAPEPGTPGYGGVRENVSGHTVTSGIPVVPPGAQTDAQTRPDTASQNTASSKKKKKKGRSKLPLVGGLVIVVGAGVYGAGLLMNRSDVPKGTTVLGVDIGGGTRDDAVKKMDDVFGKRVDQALKLSVDGDTVSLRPDQAGLQLDEQATVSAAATSDYNPVSVIGSLFGQHRVIDPVMPVDEEKLRAALENAAGGSGSATDGTIKFESGKAVAVYGKAGKGIDVDRSVAAVEQAYRTQVETGTAAAVTLPTTTKQPSVSNAEVDREMKAFAEPAMSAKITVQTDAAHSIVFSPENSLWKFLRVKAVNGKLVDSPDMAALQGLYGNLFDGVLITRGTGQKTAVTPQDVYGAVRQALLSKTDRVVTIETNPS
ncbi:hypothetical protein ABZ896_50680, partial [Streptomyces sp. NPDC047072]